MCTHLAHQHHHRRDRARARQHGNAQRHDTCIFLLRSLFLVAGGLLRGRALGLQHVDSDQQQDQAAGNLKRRQRDAEHAKDELPRKRKRRQHDEARQRSFACHALAPRGIGSRGDGEKRPDRRERIDQKKDGTQGQQREAHNGRAGQLGQRSFCGVRPTHHHLEPTNPRNDSTTLWPCASSTGAFPGRITRPVSHPASRAASSSRTTSERNRASSGRTSIAAAMAA